MTTKMPVHRLNSGWTMSTDPSDDGLARGWDRSPASVGRPAPVPGIIQQVAPDYHGVAWYWCELEPVAVPPSRRVLLTFQRVAYSATVWLNGERLGSHEGADGPFSFDITEQLVPTQANVLAARVINPTEKPTDGLTLADVPHGNAKPVDSYTPGSGLNVGGIIDEVLVHVEPVLRIDDVFVRADLESGAIAIDVTVTGSSSTDNKMVLSATAREDRTGLLVAHAEAPLAPAQTTGTAVARLILEIASPRAWDVDDPFLYLVQARLEPAGGGEVVHEVVVRTGFRELCVRDGYFSLNGRRIYLRSTHTGNHYPIGQIVPVNPAFVRQDLIYAKAAGFNTVRFLSGPARDDQLSFCDEIGLMVYEEATASWGLAGSPRMAEHYDRSFGEMIKCHRNHPSVVIWGLLNETYDGPVFRHAVDYLQTLRSLDDTRLVLLSSGRWDGDRAVGSVANPREATWSHSWGAEQQDAAPVDVGWEGDPDRGAYVAGMGDLHLYPRLPESERAKQILRTMGEGTKPVFLSEYGVGSLFDAVTERADAARWLTDVVPPDQAYISSMAERFEQDWQRFDMASLYCFPEDAIRESQLNQSLHRAATFDLIRSNGAIAGYNLTGMLDHALTGEGSWSFWRRWKPGAMEALSNGWSPLRWCLSVTPSVTYSGQSVAVDLSLANEDTLGPGSYPITLAALGPDGRRLERTSVVEIGPPAKGRPLASSVFSERVPLDGPPGEYRFAASMGVVASPAAGRASAYVVDRPAVSSKVRLLAIGLNETELSWLRANGVESETDPASIANHDLLFIGHDVPGPPDCWPQVASALQRGARVIVASPGEHIAPGEKQGFLPFSTGVSVSTFHDWLYHKECFANRHRLFCNLPGPGLMRWSYYGDVLPSHLVHGQSEEIAAFAVAIGYPVRDGYTSGLLAASFRQGSGRLVVSSFDLLRNLGSLAVADHLMINLVRWAAT